MAIVLDVLIIFACILGLWWGAVLVVDSGARIGQRMGLSQLVIGLTIVAMGTSAPEFAVTIGAAFRGSADISVGNVVGSNIFNLGPILGGVAVISAILITRPLVLRDGLVLVGSTLLVLIFVMDMRLTRWEGLVLVGLLVAYLAFLIGRRAGLEEDLVISAFRLRDVPLLLAGLGLVAMSGRFLVGSSTDLARVIGISEWVIGITIVAAGTSAPELATSLVAAVRGRHSISAGNLVGSNIFNILGVLGLAAALHPLALDRAALSGVVLLTGLMIFVVALMRSGWRLSRREGALLLVVSLIVWFASTQWT